MTRLRIYFLVASTFLSCCICLASTDQPESALAHAHRLSSLTGPGARPFHLKLKVSEPENPHSPYTAEIEEFWQSDQHWTRTIAAPGFQQHLVVSDGKRTEENLGDYYPLWLRSFVTAAIDPLEDSAFWERISARIVIEKHADATTTTCARGQFKIGTSDVQNDAFAVICFAHDGSLQSVARPGYSMSFDELRPFGKKRIASRYYDSPEPGTNLLGQVEALEEIDGSAPLPELPPFAREADSPVSGPIRSVALTQETFERLAIAPLSIVWPPVHSGNTSGLLSMYISVDRDGRVREVYPLNSDNAGLQDAARDQMLKWQLHPAQSDGEPTQAQAALTFRFATSREGAGASGEMSALPSTSPAPLAPIVVSPAIANSLSLKKYAPVYPADLKQQRVSGKVELKAVIGSTGRVISLTPVASTNPGFIEAATGAVQQWTYKPYLLNGSPVEIETVITINFAVP